MQPQQTALPKTKTQQSATPKPGQLRSELDRLEQLLTVDPDPLDGLSRLAQPHRLALLFRVLTCAAMRNGPDQNLSSAPARLLDVALRAAEVGVVPCALAPELRHLCTRSERRLHEADAWRAGQPLWWSPLPPATQQEALWLRLDSPNETRRSQAALIEAFAGPQAPRWLSLPRLVPRALMGNLHRELEAAEQAGTLALQRAGVGATDRLTSRRSDSVLYLSGLEPEFLDSAPTAAVLIQWCLQRLGPWLAKAEPGRHVYPPQKAMLARYPAPSDGYHAHLDNPGGDVDNGRRLTLVLYLNAPETACEGGEISLWEPEASTETSPASTLAAIGGSAVLFDSRTVAHQVLPLAPGPARWALTLWFNESPQQPNDSSVPDPSLTDILLPIKTPHLPPATVLFHELDETSTGHFVAHRSRPQALRVGLVSTVYRAGRSLDAWCEYHLGLGFDHLILIFDHLEEPAEAADAARLRKHLAETQLTIWSSSQLAAERWRSLADYDTLGPFAGSGSANPAIAARQTLNASAAVEAAKGRELGGAPLDWLVHLDSDELFYLEGDGRGGATLHSHFSAAATAGALSLRYLNHEILQPCDPSAAPHFKLNPRLAAAHLGPVGWSQLVSYLHMAQTDPRPYFTGYFNGKSAVAVKAAKSAAGVHGWALSTPSSTASRRLAGPSILHFHLASKEAFRRKYLSVAAAGTPDGGKLFEPSPLETATLERIRCLENEGTDEASLSLQLDALHDTLTTFSKPDVEILSEARLLFQPQESAWMTRFAREFPNS